MKKKIFVVIIIVLIIGAAIAYNYYQKIFSPNVKATTYIFIPTNATYNDLELILAPHLDNINNFNWVAQRKKYHDNIRAGKFKITQGMNNNELINHLRSGKAETINVIFNNQDSLEKLAGRIASQIEADSIALIQAFLDDEFLKKNELDKKTALSVFIPNSYNFYWNTSAEQFRNRMLQEYHKFWTDARINQAKAQNLSPIQVSTLASIVQKETAKVAERPRVAGLYLNRLKAFWPLQADPTIIFAIKQKYGQDTIIKRVLNKDLTIDSPYNTYSNFGLPPGPIAMPDISSINAVLQPENHDYFYMCASVTNIGAHEFAKTIAQHNINARKYQNWINKQGIKR